MKLQTPTGFHRRILAEAWTLARQRKPLWAFGFLAGILLSGAVVEPLLGSLGGLGRQAGFWSQALLAEPGNWLAGAGAAIALACQENPAFAKLWVALGTAIAVAAVVLSLAFQGALFAGLSAKKPISLHEALQAGWPHAWELGVLNVLSRVFQALLFLLALLPVVLYLLRPGVLETFAACLALLLYVPLSLAVRTVVMLAAARLVRGKKTDVFSALTASARFFRVHWLAAFETAFVSFGASLVACAAFLVGLGVLAVPFVFAWAALGAGTWAAGAAFVTALATVAGAFATVAFFGWLTSFRYAVWLRFYDRASHPLLAPRIVAKLKRLFHPLHVR